MSFIKRERNQDEVLASIKKHKTNDGDHPLLDINRRECCIASLNETVEQLPLQVSARQTLLESEKSISAANQLEAEIDEKKSKLANMQQRLEDYKLFIQRNDCMLNSPPPKPKPPVYSGDLSKLDDYLVGIKKGLEKLSKKKEAKMKQLDQDQSQALSASLDSVAPSKAQQDIHVLTQQTMAFNTSYMDLKKVNDAYQQYKKDMLAWKEITFNNAFLATDNESLKQKMAALTKLISQAKEELAIQTLEHSKRMKESVSISEKVNEQFKLVLDQWDRQQLATNPSPPELLSDKTIKVEPID